MTNQFKEYGFPETRGPNPVRRKFLKFLQRVRAEDTAQPREFMQPMCSIPPLDWTVLKLRFPELISPDSQIKTNAWRVFMAHPVSEPYRTTAKARYGKGH